MPEKCERCSSKSHHLLEIKAKDRTKCQFDLFCCSQKWYKIGHTFDLQIDLRTSFTFLSFFFWKHTHTHSHTHIKIHKHTKKTLLNDNRIKSRAHAFYGMKHKSKVPIVEHPIQLHFHSWFAKYSDSIDDSIENSPNANYIMFHNNCGRCYWWPFLFLNIRKSFRSS